MRAIQEGGQNRLGGLTLAGVVDVLELDLARVSLFEGNRTSLIQALDRIPRPSDEANGLDGLVNSRLVGNNDVRF